MLPSDLRTLRQRLGLTQPQLGALLGLTVGTINRYEREDGKFPIPRAVEVGMKWLELQADLKERFGN